MDLSSIAWLAVVPALGFLIVVHEIGHYWVGRKMGIKIEEFGIGFPPRAKVLFVRKGVPFTLNWLPLGGFVRFAGEESGFDDPDSLMSAPPRRRIPVLAAGVIANVLVAILLFTLIFTIWGRPVRAVIDKTEAYAASVGFQANDELISINGTPITDRNQVIEQVTSSQGQALTIVVERNDQPTTIVAAPLLNETNNAYQFGIQLRDLYEPMNLFAALWHSVTHCFTILADMFIGLTQLLGSLFGLSQAPAGGDVTGPVGIARVTGEVAQRGWHPYLQLTAFLSLNLALINILPIPALDGSRIVFALIEAVRRKKIPPEREAFVHAIGMMVLLGLMVLVTFSDVGNLIRGEPALGPPPTSTPQVGQ